MSTLQTARYHRHAATSTGKTSNVRWLIAWSWIYRLLRGHAAWTHELEQEFFRLIQLQAEFIRRYPSAHSSANNHQS